MGTGSGCGAGPDREGEQSDRDGDAFRVCGRPLSLASRGVRSDETDEAIRRLRGSSEYGDDDRELSESVGDPRVLGAPSLSETLLGLILRVGDNLSRRCLALEFGRAELVGDGTK